MTRRPSRILATFLLLLFVAITIAANAQNPVYSVQAPVIESLSATNYGATPDDAVDDTAALQRAIDAAAMSTKSRTVSLPPGEFLISDALTLPVHVTLQGSGSFPYGTPDSATTITQTEDGEHGIVITQMLNQKIFDIRIEGTGAGDSTADGIHCANGAGTYMGGGLVMSNVTAMGWRRGYYEHSANVVSAYRCAFLENETYSVYLEGVPDTHVFVDCMTGNEAGSTCYYVDGAKGLQIVGGEAGNCTYYMYTQDGSTVGVTNGNFETFSGAYLIRAANGNITMTGCNVQNSGTIPMVRMESSNGTVSLNNIRVAGNDFQSSGEPLGAQVITGTFKTPSITGATMAVGIYTDNTFGSLKSWYTSVPGKFSATSAAGQTVTSGTWTTIQYGTERYDAGFGTAGAYNSGNYRWTPGEPGYYSFKATVRVNGTTSSYTGIRFLKNGAEIARPLLLGAIPAGSTFGGSADFELDGDDYVECQIIHGTGSDISFGGTQAESFWSGFKQP